MSGAGAGTGAGGDVATGEMSIEKKLFSAINSGEKSLEKFTSLLKAYKKDWAALTDTWSWTPLEKEDSLLMRAARNNYLEIMRHLLDLKAAPEEKSALANQSKSDGITSLYIAAERGHTEILNALIDAGADINQACLDRGTPLFIASTLGNVEVVKALIAEGAAINQANTDEVTPLYRASEHGHLDVVKALLAAGANINQACLDRGTPLSMAAFAGKLNIVKALIEHIETIRFSNPDAFKAFQRDLISVSELATLSEEMREWSPARAAFISAVARAPARGPAAAFSFRAGAEAGLKRPCTGGSDPKDQGPR